MKVKLTTSRVGTGFNQACGDVIEVPADEAARMVAGELAVYVERPAPAATRTADAPPQQTRTATKPRGRTK